MFGFRRKKLLVFPSENLCFFSVYNEVKRYDTVFFKDFSSVLLRIKSERTWKLIDFFSSLAQETNVMDSTCL